MNLAMSAGEPQQPKVSPMPNGSQGQMHKADVIGNAVLAVQLVR